MLENWKLAVVAASLLVGGTALADAGRRGDGKRDGSDRRAKRMAKFDTNSDGKLDRTERAAMAKAKFARLDKNNDGVLSFEEAQVMLERPQFKRGDRRRGGRANQAE